MKTKPATLLLITLAFNNACQTDDPKEAIDLVGSFFNRRSTDSGHVYVHELWLWKHSEDVLGLYLNVQGLEGSGIPPQIHKINSASLGLDGAFAFETKWYNFSGRYDGSCAQGILKQGSEVIWGGVEGSDEISLCSGSHVRGIENPPEDFNSIEEWHQWADALPGIQ